MNDKPIRKQVEGILGLHIADDNWADVWRGAEVQGKMTGSRTNQILRILCEKVEYLEKLNESKQIDEKVSA